MMNHVKSTRPIVMIEPEFPHGGYTSADVSRLFLDQPVSFEIVAHSGKAIEAADAQEPLTTVADAELRICPFCKLTWTQPILARNTWFVYCVNCGCEGPSAESREEAIDLWNQRSADEQIADLTNRLSDLVGAIALVRSESTEQIDHINNLIINAKTDMQHVGLVSKRNAIERILLSLNTKLEAIE